MERLDKSDKDTQDIPLPPEDNKSIIKKPVTKLEPSALVWPNVDLTPEQIEQVNAIVRQKTESANERVRQQGEIRTRELELKNADAEGSRQQSITFAALGLVAFVVGAAFLYAGLTGDRILPDKVLTFLLGALSGSGATAILKPKGQR